MKSKVLRIFLLVSVAIVPVYAFAVSGNDLLEKLQRELKGLRASTSDKPVALAPVPDVKLLIGLKKDLVISVLGKPDFAAEKIIYLFFHLPEGWRGEGPELVLVFSKGQKVKEASWRFSR